MTLLATLSSELDQMSAGGTLKRELALKGERMTGLRVKMLSDNGASSEGGPVGSLNDGRLLGSCDSRRLRAGRWNIPDWYGVSLGLRPLQAEEGHIPFGPRVLRRGFRCLRYFSRRAPGPRLLRQHPFDERRQLWHHSPVELMRRQPPGRRLCGVMQVGYER